MHERGVRERRVFPGKPIRCEVVDVAELEPERAAVDRERAANNVVADEQEVRDRNLEALVPGSERSAQELVSAPEQPQPTVVDEQAAGFVTERPESRPGCHPESFEARTCASFVAR